MSTESQVSTNNADNPALETETGNDSGSGLMIEPISKKKKTDLTNSDIIAQGFLAKLILSKTNECLAATTITDRASSENIKVSIDEDKKRICASVDCPVTGCKKMIALGFSQYLSPSMTNYKRHVSTNHLNLKSEKGSKIIKNQPTILDMFKKPAQSSTPGEDDSSELSADSSHGME
jgi:hypothetical protein